MIQSRQTGEHPRTIN